MVERYGVARLLAFDHDPATREPTLEVAHEAVLREWPRSARVARRGPRHAPRSTATSPPLRRVGSRAIATRASSTVAAVSLAAEALLADPAALNPVETEFLDASIGRRAELEAVAASPGSATLVRHHRDRASSPRSPSPPPSSPSGNATGLTPRPTKRGVTPHWRSTAAASRDTGGGGRAGRPGGRAGPPGGRGRARSCRPALPRRPRPAASAPKMPLPQPTSSVWRRRP